MYVKIFSKNLLFILDNALITVQRLKRIKNIPKKIKISYLTNTKITTNSRIYSIIER